jgi:hypothetical protein
MIDRISRTLALALGVALLLPGALKAADGDTQEVPIADPVFAMTAFNLTAPADWHVAGTVLPPASCDASTPLVFRATSPDGTAGRYRLPPTTWAWGSATRPKADCQLAQESISAADFLTYYARHSKVGFVKTVEIPESKRMSPMHAGQTIDQAAMLARYSVGNKQMEELISDTVMCQNTESMQIGDSHVCSATVVRSYAPLGKLTSLMPTLDLFRANVNQEWMSAWTAAMVTRTNRLYGSQTKAMLEQGAIAGAQRMQAHRDYMASMQAGADRRDIKFEAGQYQKQNNTDNYVDFILDCQRSYSGNVRVSDSSCPNRQTF